MILFTVYFMSCAVYHIYLFGKQRLPWNLPNNVYYFYRSSLLEAQYKKQSLGHSLILGIIKQLYLTNGKRYAVPYWVMDVRGRLLSTKEA